MGRNRPIVCTLTEGARGDRWVRWRDALRREATHVAKTPDGVSIALKGSDWGLTEISNLVEAERSCCAWMDFGLKRDEASVTLTISADSDEGAQVIRNMLSLEG